MIENETGLIIEKKNEEDLLNAMIKVFNNRELLKEFSNKANEFAVENFEQKKLFEYIIKDRKKIMENNNSKCN